MNNAAPIWSGLSSDQWRQVEPTDRGYVAKMCRKHGEIGQPLAVDYLHRLGDMSRADANARLRELSQSLELGKTGLTAMVRDDELVKWCERHASEVAESCDEWTKRAGAQEAINYAWKRVHECGLDFPIADPDNASPEDWGQALARVFDPKWWRLQVRRIQARKIEAVAREIRLVHKEAGIYASNITVKRRGNQKQRNYEALLNMEAVNDDGDVLSLVDCVKASVSNPVNRRAELMVRIKGFEQCAEAAGHVGLFITLTAPSKYHRMTYIKSWGRVVPNRKYAGYSPRDAQGYFCRVWSHIRAQLWREGIRPYGFRVAEPHHDGTPHWHLLLFVDPEQSDRLEEIMQEYGTREDGRERGAQRQRVKTVRIDPDKGSAAGYIAKYIAKNIDGHGIETDLYGQPAESSANRIDAWAAAWGIRQFQQIGGASVTVWRELRRLKIEEMTGRFDLSQEQAEKLIDTWTAADSADWAAYTMLQGGMTVRRADQFIRSQYQPDGLGRYYQPVNRLVGFAVTGLCSMLTRFTRWTLQRAGTAEKQAERFSREGGWNAEHRAFCVDEWAEIFGPWTGVTYGHQGGPERPAPFSNVADYRRAANAATWTRGNNCTEPPGAGKLLPWTPPPGGGQPPGKAGAVGG